MNRSCHPSRMNDISFSFDSFASGDSLHVYNADHPDCGGQGINERTNLFEEKICRDSEYLYHEYSYNQEKAEDGGILLFDEDQYQYHLSESEFKATDNGEFNLDATQIPQSNELATVDSLPTLISTDVKTQEEKPFSSMHFSSFFSLLNQKSRFMRLNTEQESSYHKNRSNVDGPRLSTVEVMKVAGARYLQLCMEKDDDLSMPQHPFGYALSGLSHKEIEDVELVHLLLRAAAKVGNQQYSKATKFLNQCYDKASATGNPVQRIAYYLAKALQERIQNEISTQISSQWLRDGTPVVDHEEQLLNLCPALISYFQEIPIARVLQFAAMQTILENIASAKKVHLIDLNVRSGMHWIVIMQALASTLTNSSCPYLLLLRVTAFVTTRFAQEKAEETGKRLLNFAETVKIPFLFKVALVTNMEQDLREDLFEVQSDEKVAVFSPFFLNKLLVKPDQLETLMKVIKRLHPSVMVVSEVEANLNSRSFTTRFIEALFFYSAFFDSIDTCLNRNNEDRIIIEELVAGERIRNIVAFEGEERSMRHVTMDVWRAFFERFGMVETQLSESSLFQARLILERFPSGSSCTLDMSDHCLLVGWKGTPSFSLSVWKF